MAFGYEATQPTFTSGEALEADRLVLLTASTAKYADGGENPVGLTKEAVASGADVAVGVLTGSVQKVTASKAIAANTAIYVTTDGKVSDAAVGAQIGITVEAATTANGKVAAIIWQIGRANDALRPRSNNVEFFDDFFSYDSTATVGRWVEQSDGGTIANAAGTDGHLSIATDTSDNDESYVSSVVDQFFFTAAKNVHFECKLQLTEANTNDANIIAGLSSVYGANTLVDNGAGPATTFDGAVFYKVDGTMEWETVTSNAAAQTITASVATYASATWYKLEIDYDYNDGVTASVKYYVDGVLVNTDALTIAGLAAMSALLGVKAGDTNAETLIVDYVQVITTRTA